jgi:phosphopantothenoylcysteine decarboxylase/phosphopantothenate--cysteine ligase
MAAGIADDLATTLLLATDKPVVVAPAMNVRMWLHPATQANIATLKARGVQVIEPVEGEMACGEYGPGRLPEPAEIMSSLRLGAPARPELVEGLSVIPKHEQVSQSASLGREAPLQGIYVLVTAGPTHEPIDPVRVIANRSSGKQGFAIAAAAAQAGARVTLIAGPVSLPTPGGVARIDVETADQMLSAVETALPCDAAVMVAAVADWKVAPSATKLKKVDGPPTIRLLPNPDILATLASHPLRPRLLVGFAAETDDLLANAAAKRTRKGVDWIVANDVSGDVMGGSHNHVHLLTADGSEAWDNAPKDDVARRLVARIAQELKPA